MANNSFSDLRDAYYDASSSLAKLVGSLNSEEGKLGELGQAAERINEAFDRDLGILGNVL